MFKPPSFVAESNLPGLQGKLKTAGHYADDRVGFTVKNDRSAEDVRIPLIAVRPQGIANNGKRLMRVLLLLGKDTAKDRLNA